MTDSFEGFQEKHGMEEEPSSGITPSTDLSVGKVILAGCVAVGILLASSVLTVALGVKLGNQWTNKE